MNKNRYSDFVRNHQAKSVLNVVEAVSQLMDHYIAVNGAYTGLDKSNSNLLNEVLCLKPILTLKGVID